jgi:tetratricopeptide (TPR) repeat protein
MRAAITARPGLEALEAALKVNPRDLEGVTLAAAESLRRKDLGRAARWLGALVELKPEDAGGWRDYAAVLYERGPRAESEQALRRARELNPKDAALAERLGRVRLEAKDTAQALALFDASLQLAPGNLELWLLAADLGRAGGDAEREARSLEQALTLRSDQVERRTRLVQLLLDQGRAERARFHADAAEAGLPANVAVLTVYAGFRAKLSQPERELALWRRTVAADAAHEPGHYNVVRLLRATDKRPEALAYATGLRERRIGSPRLLLLHAQLEEEAGDPYAARRTLTAAAAQFGDLSVLRARAAQEDLYGKDAAAAYRQLAEALEKTADGKEELKRVLERGERVALRDAQASQTAWFAVRLRPLMRVAVEMEARTVEDAPAAILGGPAGLAFAAHMPAKTAAADFFEEYARTIVTRLGADKKAAEIYRDELLEYFDKVRQLSAWGQTADNRVTIRLSLESKAAKALTQRVVEFLGYKLKTSRGKVALDAGEKKAAARKQELLSALAVDQVGMEEALEGGKDFILEIENGSAPVAFGEAVWMKEFAGKSGGSKSLAELLVRVPEAAQLYAGLASASRPAAHALLQSPGLRAMAGGREPELLFAYGAALALDERGRVHLPGGWAAAGVWQKLVQADPASPAAFFQQLMRREDGKLLAYFASLSQIDELHQRFFTRTPERLAAYFELFRNAPEVKRGAALRMRQHSFADFLREIPLEDDLSVRWPGSAEVWMVARGTSDVGKSQRLMKKVKKAVAPAEEDDILLRMARRRYEASHEVHSQLENFLAVSRLDARRERPLTETEALLMAQSVTETSGAFPYFLVFTELGEEDYRKFLRFAERMGQAHGVDTNLLLTHFYAPAELLSLLRQEEALNKAQASALFSALCGRLEKAAGRAEWAEASAAALAEIRAAVKPREADVQAETWWVDILSGPRGPAADGADPGAQRRDAMRRFLQMQKAPEIDLLLRMTAMAQELARKPREAAALATALERDGAGLPRMELSKQQKPKPEQRQTLESFNAMGLSRLLLEVKKQATKKKLNPKTFEKLSRELLAELAAPLGLAVLALDYAYFLRPSDLAAEDAWLVRKHNFIPLDGGRTRLTWFGDADFQVTSEGLGSFAAGSLAGLAQTAGRIAAAGRPGTAGQAGPVLTAQFAALRAAPLWQMTVAEQRRFKLRVLAAREWVTEAARSAPLRTSLGEATVGLLAPNRQRRLLAAVEAGDPEKAWPHMSLADLYWLGQRLASRTEGPEPWPSPLWAALRSAGKPVRLDLLGPVALAIHGDPVPRLEPLPPYEDFERYLFPDRLAERVAEFKLYLIWHADHAGADPRSVAAGADAACEQAAAGLKPASLHDWVSALRAWEAYRPAGENGAKGGKP